MPTQFGISCEGEKCSNVKVGCAKAPRNLLSLKVTSVCTVIRNIATLLTLLTKANRNFTNMTFRVRGLRG